MQADDGYAREDWWSEAGLQWRASSFPAPSPMYGQHNAPQGGVTWHEANAFCRWLSFRLGVQTRLPTEIEWEWAARGPVGYLYPWGNEPDGTLANTLEAGILAPCAVGTFPARTPWGESGPVDLIGNVWEWCSTAVESETTSAGGLRHFGYPYVAGDGRESAIGGDVVKRATRGGYFGTSQAVSRSSLRGRDVPSSRVLRQGFRVVGDEKS